MTPALAQEATTATAETAVKDFSVGSPDAKVKMVEYASFTCPHCATFHETVYPQLKTEYIDTGKVHFTLREVYFDRYGLWAALIARCGGDMKYFGIHDMLFAQQKDWAASEDPMQVVEKLKTIGRAAGLEDAAMDACLNDTANAEALIKQFQTNFEADGVEGTPTLFINGSKHGNMAYEDLKAILDAELAK
ncbi:DsbA family protein [Tabrizicola sp.]|uniref:DsbA family protein n=1 Tax=Tabrizicola sp. TaxID=2005166 RepID=UPI0025D8D9B8|nr:DsbA family protein [Tabrizicola sp.]